MELALDQCGKWSAPGWDGLPFEFWQNIKALVVKPFTEVCRRITEENDLTNGNWPVLVGTLLHKKGDKSLLGNYRLLSIMDSDLRWRAKALLNKLMPALDSFISGEQTAFLENRQITDNVVAVMLVIEETRSTQTDGCILALDQEKAYDRVRWECSGYSTFYITSVYRRV